MSSKLIIEVITSSIMGGSIGWVTNAVAIDMLFKKYWKWGGVVEENYEEFIKNMSQLVEDDLVNEKTLQHEFSSDTFRNVLRKWVGDIIKKELPENSGSLRLEDIPGIEKSVDGVISLVDKIQPMLIKGIYGAVSGDKLNAIVSQKQYNYIIDTNVQSISSNKGNYEYKIQSALGSFLQDKTLNAVISGRAIRQIAENIGAVIQNVDFSKHDGDLNIGYNELLTALEIDRLIKDLQDDLGRMRFSDFVNNSQKLSRDLIKKVLDFVRSNDGQKLFYSLINDFLQDTRNINLKLADVVSPSVEEGIISFCENKMPDIIDRIVSFIRNTRDEIEKIVNDTVDNQLDSTIGGKIGKFFKDIFTRNLAGSVDVIGRIVKAIKDYGDEAGAELSKQIIRLLETKTIGEIAGTILDSGVIDIPSIIDLINRHLKDLENKEFSFIDKLLEKEIGISFSGIDLSIIKTKVLPKIFDHIKQEYLYNEKFKRDINAGITSKADDLATKVISDFFNVSEINITLNPEKIKNSLFGLWNNISETRISDIIGKQIQIPNIKRKTFENLWNDNKERELNQIYNAMQKDTVYTKFADSIIDIVNQNLGTLLTGNVSSLVNTELSKMRPAQINNMVQDFMGKEMKPINILGAALGLIIGGVSAIAASVAGIPGNFLWWMLAVYGTIFAIVGIGTNWLAIKMLFRPFKGLYKGAKIPPFIGVVAARKPEFAKNISSFIKDKMLSDDALKNFFLENKDKVKNICFEKISTENYAIIDTLFYGNNERLVYISNAICNAIQSYLTENRAKVVSAIANAMKDLVKDGKLYDLIPALRDTIIIKLQEMDIAALVTNLIKKETEGKSLGSYKKVIDGFADMQLKNLFTIIAQNLTREITLDKVKRIIADQNDAFVSYIEKHSIGDLAGDNVIEDFIQKISSNIGPMLHSGIAPIVKSLEKEELNPNKKLNEVFGGAFPGLLKKSIGFLINIISEKVGSLRGDITGQIESDMPVYIIPWKGHVAPIVNTLLDKELPRFLRRKQDELERIAETLLENRLSDIGFNNKTLDIKTIENTVASILDSPHVQKGVSHFAGIIIKQFTALPIRSLLGLINIRNINDIVRVAEPLLSGAVGHLKDKISRDEVIDVIVKLVKSMLMKQLDKIAIDELLNNIELEKELRTLVEKLVSDNNVMREVSGMIEDALRTIERNPSFYDDGFLRADMEKYLLVFGGDNRLQKYLQSALTEILLHINSVLTLETKNAVCNDYLLSAIVNSAVYNFSNVIGVIDVQTVVEREINNMHPSGVEKLFYKFAGKYFAKITLYGWVGSIGGFLSYLISCLFGKFLK
jgi:uncharacterized membrane protein YheB (UPF0754 family)